MSVKRNITKNNKGMTLVEIVVTIAFLGIVMIPVISQLGTINTINIGSSEKLESYNLCQSYLEQLISADEVTIDLLQDQEQYKSYYVMIKIEEAQDPNGTAYYYYRDPYGLFSNVKIYVDTTIGTSTESSYERFIVIKYNDDTQNFNIESESSIGQINGVYSSENIDHIDITYSTDWPLYRITVVVDNDDDFTDATTQLVCLHYID